MDRSNPRCISPFTNSLRAQPGREADVETALKESERAKADYHRLAQLLTEDLKKSPDDADLFAEVGELCLRLDREPMGIHWLFEALEEGPNCKRAHQALADYYEEKGDAAEAKRYRLPAE